MKRDWERTAVIAILLLKKGNLLRLIILPSPSITGYWDTRQIPSTEWLPGTALKFQSFGCKFVYSLIAQYAYFCHRNIVVQIHVATWCARFFEEIFTIVWPKKVFTSVACELWMKTDFKYCSSMLCEIWVTVGKRFFYWTARLCKDFMGCMLIQHRCSGYDCRQSFESFLYLFLLNHLKAISKAASNPSVVFSRTSSTSFILCLSIGLYVYQSS